MTELEMTGRQGERRTAAAGNTVIAPVPEPGSLAPGGGRLRRRVAVRGLVQGVGFRPFVYATATELDLTGSVINSSDGVQIEVEGAPERVEEFVRRLTEKPPPLAIVESIEITGTPARGGTGFHIGDSARGADGRTLSSPDVACCSECLADMTDPADRRYRHPFVSCTNCGPRFTIITDLPYDRASTTMACFAMCSACRDEYTDVGDRRFHAQPIACRDCGPRLELIAPGGAVVRGDDAALAEARRLLDTGAVLAVKGLGGYHLVCDATNEQAVAELRRRKRRGDKPFAVMVPDVATAADLVDVGAAEADLLTGAARPIVLLARRSADGGPDPKANTSTLGFPARSGTPTPAPSVAPGSPDLGIMLPYTPLHTLLFGLPGDPPSPRVLVMTSGNLSGEPIVTDDRAALELLGPLVDGWLRHDRRIHVPCDDSVSRIVDGEPLPIRRSRGYAPLPLALPTPVAAALAVGADLKNTCCIAEGRYAWMSQHIGDMDDLRSLDTLSQTAAHLEKLTGVRPGRLVADQHPDYRSAGWAAAHRGERELSTVQHHHAHLCSVMAEHGLDGSSPVIGIAFDGTGFGTDGAVWGGEVLIARYREFRRFGHLKYVPLPGGDAAVERPYRMALSHLRSAGVAWSPELACVAHCPAAEQAVLARQLETGFGCVPTSSMGRLFDAVSAIAGVRQVADYEAQAAIELEGLSRSGMSGDGMPRARAYYFSIADSSGPESGGPVPVLIDSGPVIRAVAADALAGVAPGIIGARFHTAVVQLVTDMADRVRAELGLHTVALSGGVFQNAVLLGGACTALRRNGFTVLRHRRVPPNDGGLALGQLVAGAKQAI
ncbi:MAG: carbamoyltransferase HypF [Actinomycetota bacterium]|nr:carbamoyltransferase HypF [Actinomycetota bacterium]